jgi:sugar/nucleoside kinase (ribokinase family)
MTKVLSVGIATVDNIVLVEKYPAANERVVALDSIRAVGGPATTAAVTLARLGVEVALSCVIGDDDDGRFILETLKREGVDINKVIINPEIRTAVGTIVVSKSEETRALNCLQSQPISTITAGYMSINLE